MKLDTTRDTDRSASAATAPTPEADSTDAKQLPKGRDNGTETEAGIESAPGCLHCGAAATGPTSWCSACGYHPALRQCVQLDSMPETEDAPVDLSTIIPRWVWIAAAGVVGIVLASLAVRVGIAADTGLRAWWALIQLTVGELAAVSAHILAFVYSSMRHSHIGPFDMILKPVEIWKPVFRDMPKQAWRLWAFAWGETAAICALLIIGGISYEALFEDWGFRKRASVNVAQAIVEQAREEQADMTMQEAMDEFAGNAGTEDPESDDDPPQEKPPVVAECLIIGYRASGAENGRPSALLLAAMHRGKLKYAGIISAAGVPEQQRAELAERLPQLKRDRPFVRCRHRAQWLHPVLMCQVESEGWSKGGMLKKPRFRRMLADLPLERNY